MVAAMVDYTFGLLLDGPLAKTIIYVTVEVVKDDGFYLVYRVAKKGIREIWVLPEDGRINKDYNMVILL